MSSRSTSRHCTFVDRLTADCKTIEQLSSRSFVCLIAAVMPEGLEGQKGRILCNFKKLEPYSVGLRHHSGNQTNKQFPIIEREPSCSIVLQLAILHDNMSKPVAGGIV